MSCSLSSGAPLATAAAGGPPEHATLSDALRSSAALSDRGITYVRAGGSSTCTSSYADILAAAQHVLGGLQKLGMAKGDVCVMQISELPAHIHAIWGCILGGVAPVNISVPRAYDIGSPVVQKLLGVLEDLQAKHVLASTANVPPLRQLLPQIDEGQLTGVHDLAQLDLSSPAERYPVIEPTDILFYQLTSGSTGRSKCIPERHCAVVSHIRHSIAHCGYLMTDVMCNWLPFDHVVPMLTYHLGNVYHGRSAVEIPTPDVLADPLLWMRTLAVHRATHSWAPNFGFKLVVNALREATPPDTTAGPLSVDLTTLRRLMNAGEQVTTDVCDAFIAALGLRPNVMQPAFGMAEACTCMTYNNEYGARPSLAITKASLSGPRLVVADGDAEAANWPREVQVMRFADLGPPSPGVELRIARNGGPDVLDELQVGHLQIRGACVMLGYHDNPVANSECYPGDGWFDSGDLGFVCDGRLFLTGRAKEMIIIRGANLYCYDVEAVAMQVAGTLPPLAAATSVYDPAEATEALLLFFVVEPEALPAVEVAALHELGRVSERIGALVGEVRHAVTSGLGVAPRCAIPVLEEHFHRTTSGKIQRGAFKKEYEAGKYALAAEALAHAANGTAVSEYRVEWPVLPPESAAASECTEDPLYILSPQQSTTVGAGITAFAAAQPGCFATTLAFDLHAQREQIASSDLTEWAAFVTRPWLVALVLDDARDSCGVAPCLRSLFVALELLRQPCFADEAAVRPRALLLTCGAIAASPTDACVPGAAHGGVWGLATSARLDQPRMALRQADLLAARDLEVARHAQLVLADARSSGAEMQACWRGGARRVARLRRAERHGPLASGGVVAGVARRVMITGGLGGLGVSAARRLLAASACDISLLSRSGRLRGGEQPALVLVDLFAAYAGRLEVRAVDCTSKAELVGVRCALGLACATIHMASAEVAWTAFGQLEWAGLFTEQAAKAVAAHALHAAAARSSTEPSVCISSVSSFSGVAGAYSASNAFLDSMAAAMAKRGVPMSSLLLPPVREVGMAARMYGERLEAGATPLGDLAIGASQVALHLLNHLRWPVSSVHLLLPLKAELVATGLSVLLPSSSTLLEEIQPSTAARAAVAAPPADDAAFASDVLEVLKRATRKPLTARTLFRGAGIDSLAAIAAATQLSALVDLPLTPMVLFEHASPADLAAHLYDRLHGSGSHKAGCDEAAAALADTLLDIRLERERIERAGVAQARVSAAAQQSASAVGKSVGEDLEERPRYALVGGGGHAREIIMFMRQEGRCEIVGIFDDDVASHGTLVEGVRVVGGTGSLPVGVNLLIAIGQNEVRKKIALKLDEVGANDGRPFWPRNGALVSESATVGAGTYIGPGVVVGPRASIGRHCILQPGAFVAHDALIGNYAFVGGRAMVAGFSALDEGAVLGMGAIVAPKKRVGAWTTVMIQSAVVSDIPEHVTCGGVPAVVMSESERTKVV